VRKRCFKLNTKCKNHTHTKPDEMYFIYFKIVVLQKTLSRKPIKRRYPNGKLTQEDAQYH